MNFDAIENLSKNDIEQLYDDIIDNQDRISNFSLDLYIECFENSTNKKVTGHAYEYKSSYWRCGQLPWISIGGENYAGDGHLRQLNCGSRFYSIIYNCT